eukprot:CAMPEP_0201594862 /NCGR_PEP_ID=MMETSP0190_2-20130828/192048_1 /ASSEMBLY_ACC=CAM_ASM_000263 /TAXON_ID=37353 /ORGANISM="Rosalina sp." /LENGTH=145 /DNA_ID=CAMNT_0048054639 /DNA_START=166 /DNA_END=600 /DNA_ORIENTATION=-
MAVSPNITGNGIDPLSYGDVIRKSINKSLSPSPRPAGAPANITGLNSPWSPVSPTNSPTSTMNSPVSCVSPVNIISSPTSISNIKSGFPAPITPKSSPITPKSKASSRNKVKMMRSFVYSEKNAMKKKGYVPFKSIGSTLQGSIW